MQKKKTKKTVVHGRVYITATFNNTLVTITDNLGHPIVAGSCGMHGFAGTRKSTPYAATITANAALNKAVNDYDLKEIVVFVKGIGPGREAALRAIKNSNIEIIKIIDITPIPHNGIRPPKIRRV